jgi:uncharacterized membrane protein YdbT with pleckstrin-like domain
MIEPEFKPVVTKSFVKGVIAIFVFSIFLSVNTSHILNYLIFLATMLALVLGYALVKRASTYVLTEDHLTIRSFLKPEKSINYNDIEDLSISQGILARRFACGTIFVDLKRNNNDSRIYGKQVEMLRDVKQPEKVCEMIADRKGQFG